MRMMRWMMAAVVLLLLMAACSKDTEDKLLGRWQLKEVVEADGNLQKVDTVWYNFQTSIFMYQIYDASREGSNYRKSYGYTGTEEENRVWIQLFDAPQPVAEFIEYTDWSSPQRTFIIEKLTGKELVLHGDGKQYIFRKY